MHNFYSRPHFLAFLLLSGLLIACQPIVASSATPQATRWEYKSLVMAIRFDAKDNLFTKEGDISDCSVDLVAAYLNKESASSNLCVVEDGNPDTIAILNQLGSDGWELVSTPMLTLNLNVITFIFRRPLQ